MVIPQYTNMPDLTTIAIAYDFDGTLAPGNMQEHSFIPRLNMDKNTFWHEANELAKVHDMDGNLAYMQLMLVKAAENKIPVRKQDFLDQGNDITFFPGVLSFFDRINAYANSKNIRIEHHIISSGLREIIQGTPIAKQFKNIFASGYVFNENEVAKWPALAINYTNKTQYLFRINKGIHNSWDNSTINKYIEMDRRPIPFSRMIYVGDGLTDVPAMKMIKYQGGAAVAVYDENDRPMEGRKTARELCLELIEQDRADFIAQANYTENSKLDTILKTLINKIAEEVKLLQMTGI